MPRAPRLSKAQARFLDEHAPAYLCWQEDAGTAIPVAPHKGQKRTFDAMIRKEFLTPDGHMTELGKTTWLKTFA